MILRGCFFPAIGLTGFSCQAAHTVLSFWTTKVPTAAWITIFWAVIVAINVGAVTVFGEVEVVASSIKFGWIFVVIISMIGT